MIPPESWPGQAAEHTEGFRLFTVPGLVDAAASAWRHNTGLFLALSLLGLLPIGAMLIGLEYVAHVRRLFATTYEHDYLVVLAALALPVLLGWRSLCAAAMSRAAVEILRRDALSIAQRAQLPELTAWALISEASTRGLHVIFAGLVRAVFVWVAPAAVVIFAIRADPDMESFVLWAVGIATFAVCASGAALISGLMMQMMPSAALTAPGRRARKGSETTVRGVGLSFLLGFLCLLLGVNLHLFVGLLLMLADALFDMDVSYWQQFFAMSNGLWFWVVWLLTAVLMEPIAQASAAYLWVDGRVRRDALDLRGMLAAVKRDGGARSLAATSRPNPSESGDRATLGVVLAIAVAASVGLAPPPAQAQDGLMGEASVGSDVREARQILAETDEYGWSDLEALDTFVSGKVDGATTEGEAAYWREVHSAVADVRSTWGEERDRARTRLETVLDADGIETGSVSVDAETVERGLAEILAQEEFVDLASKEVDRGRPEVDLRRRRWERPEEERQTCCDAGDWNRAGPSEPSGIDAPNFQIQGEIFKVLAIVLIVVAAGLLLLAIVRRYQGGKTAPRGQPIVAAAMDLETPGQEDALAFTAEDWQTRAVRLADGGDYRLAIRSLYLALLVALHRRQLIAYDESKTNWEYETELRGKLRRRQVAGASPLDGFTRLTGTFDLVWYGERDADRTMFEQCLGWARAVNSDGGQGGV